RLAFHFSGSDAVALRHRQHEHATIADLAGPRRLNDRLDGVFRDRIGHDDFDFHLRQEADVVLLAAINGGMPFLLAVATHFSDRHPGDIEFRQGILYFVDLVGPDDTLQQLHMCPSNVRCRSEVSAICSASVSLAPALVMWNTSIAFSPSVAIRTRSTSHPCCEMTRLIRYSNPSALLATISTIVK